jgi:hypothetical protein
MMVVEEDVDVHNTREVLFRLEPTCHRFVRHSSMRSSFVDGWNVTPSIRCSGSCTG